ncbi:MAG: TlpA disulfide reductase family protein [bacterium]
MARLWTLFWLLSAAPLAGSLVSANAFAEGTSSPEPAAASAAAAPPDSARAAVAPLLDLDSLHGKVVYLDFWASWCGPCAKSFPWLSQIQSRFGEQGLVVIGVNVDRERKLADGFLEKHSPGFRIVYDPEGKLARQYDLKGMPSSFLIDRDGKRRSAHVGFREDDIPALEDQIRGLLKEGVKTP